ncbi:hypothetical protein RclHR1_00680019 [Rhizophagus clarus]|uniref:Uncharacterized protein n=1 Tax=Rhizophagus clarus TaxID=94130 RepID=A0A2Z6S6F9_9GLOM|nr:hypothetical protein RclHR1_00680019 [Rhizophagus clarus]
MGHMKSCDLGNSQSVAIEYESNNLYAKAKLLINKKDANETERDFKMLEETVNTGLVISKTYLGEYYKKEGNFEEAIKFYFKAAKQRYGRYSHIAQYHFKELSKDI